MLGKNKTVSIDWATFEPKGKIRLKKLTKKQTKLLRTAIPMGVAFTACTEALRQTAYADVLSSLPDAYTGDFGVPSGVSDSVYGVPMTYAHDGSGAVVHVSSHDTMESDTAWGDSVVILLQHQGLPLALIMGSWACLEAIIGKPASAIDRVKWAILGILALKYVPGFIRHIGASA